jgi:hypothetical protein
LSEENPPSLKVNVRYHTRLYKNGSVIEKIIDHYSLRIVEKERIAYANKY